MDAHPRSCAWCDHYQADGRCLWWSASPPDEVIPVGCEQWLDRIPF